MPSVQRRILPLGISHGWILYGRRIYELMRYWDEEHTEWDAAECELADAWRSQPKWVVSRSLKDVGPNATLVSDDVEAVVRGLKAGLVRSRDPAICP